MREVECRSILYGDRSLLLVALVTCKGATKEKVEQIEGGRELRVMR